MTDDLYDRFLAHVRDRAVGRDHAQKAVTICAALGLEPSERNRRLLRACANRAGKDRHLVCAGPFGYYVPNTPAEASVSTRRMRSQAYEMLRRAKLEDELVAATFELREEPEPDRPRPGLFELIEATS